jgi:hypothetical protein
MKGVMDKTERRLPAAGEESGSVPGRFLHEESGSLMGNVIFFGIIALIIGIVVIDGISVFSTYRRVSEVTERAGDQAKYVFDTEKSDIKAENAAADVCEAEGMVFQNFEVRIEYGHTYMITCSDEAHTYFFKYIPKLKDLTRQESTVYTSEV